MTGRRLYDKYCDAVAAQTGSWERANGRISTVPPQGVLAWPFLGHQDRSLWNDLARRLTPKPRKRA